MPKVIYMRLNQSYKTFSDFMMSSISQKKSHLKDRQVDSKKNLSLALVDLSQLNDVWRIE